MDVQAITGGLTGMLVGRFDFIPEGDQSGLELYFTPKETT